MDGREPAKPPIGERESSEERQERQKPALRTGEAPLELACPKKRWKDPPFFINRLFRLGHVQ